jgi:hypothetical protein
VITRIYTDRRGSGLAVYRACLAPDPEAGSTDVQGTGPSIWAAIQDLAGRMLECERARQAPAGGAARPAPERSPATAQQLADLIRVTWSHGQAVSRPYLLELAGGRRDVVDAALAQCGLGGSGAKRPDIAP